MGFEISIKPMKIKFKDSQYNFQSLGGLSEFSKKIISSLIYKYNREINNLKIDADYTKYHNVCLVCLEEGIVLVKLIPNNQKGIFIHDLAGMIFPLSKAATVNYYLSQLIVILCSVEMEKLEHMYCLEEKEIISLYNEGIKRYENNQEFVNLLKQVSAFKVVQNFVFFPENVFYDNTNFLVLENGCDTKIPKRQVSLLERLVPENKVNIIETDNDEIFLMPEIPTIKERPKEENYFKERRKIKLQLKQNQYNWVWKSRCGNINIKAYEGNGKVEWKYLMDILDKKQDV